MINFMEHQLVLYQCVLDVVLSDPTLAEGLGGGTIPPQLADQAVKAVRKMLREKKAS